MQDQRIVRRTRTALFAGVSAVALMAASPAAKAADLPTKAPPIVLPAAPKDHWTWWAEGGAFNTGDPAFGPFPFLLSPLGIVPGIGWEGAIGFDFVPATLQGYHFSGQFRYGAAQRTKKFPGSVAVSTPKLAFIYPTPGRSPRLTSAFVGGVGSAHLQEHHWLVDFMVGRDFLLGSSQAQAQLGIRVADIFAKVKGSGTLFGSDTPPPAFGTPITGVFSFTSRSKFLGIGPRLGILGAQPLGGSWALDYLAGVAVLFGDRKFDQTSSMTLVLDPAVTPKFNIQNTALHSSSFGAVANLDAQLGISYWFTSNVKMTVSYRFDGYWGVLRTVNSNGGFTNQDQFYFGPMLRVTYTFPSTPP